MPGESTRALAVCVLLSSVVPHAAAAQTAVVQRPDGRTATVTVQSDGAAGTNTFVILQAPPDGQPSGSPVLVSPPGSGLALFTSVQGGSGNAATGLALGAQTGGVIGGTVQGGSAPLPPRDQAPAVGSARIQGRVVAADSGRPLRRAIVRLVSPGMRETRSATTDQDGRYEFVDLPAASYNLTASRSGYVQLGYKQSRPNTPPQPLVVGDRQTLDRIDFALPAGGVITGRVIDEFGEPMSGAFVSAQRGQYINGMRRPVPAGSPSSTNDIGEFRIYDLAPGDYFLSATARGSVMNPFEVSTDRTGYAQTYYPSTPDVAAAQLLTVGAGQTVSNIVIALTPTRMSRVSGMVLDAQGQPARSGTVIATAASGVFGGPTAPGLVRPDGSFVISALAPGEYVLRSMPTGVSLTPGSTAPMAIATISVSGSDLTNVVLQPQPPITIHGRLTGDSATLAQVKPASTRLVAAPVGPQMMPGMAGAPQALRDDLSFDLRVYPGDYVIRPASLPGMVIRAVRWNGRDVTGGFRIAPGSTLDDLEVDVTSTTARLTVTATNARNEPVPGRDIVVFPQDEGAWGSQMPGHGSTGRTNDQGQYQSPPLLPGAYYVALSEGMESGQSGDPEFLASLRAAAQRITLGDGETAAVQFRVSGR